MAIFRVQGDKLEPVEQTDFPTEKVRERQDLQRLLRANIEVISPGTLVIAEEFGDFEGHRRRIDLLGVDGDANLVVVELKRTEDGGLMDLQAIRYAAMVSTITFERAVSIYQDYLDSMEMAGQAQELLLEHFNWEEPDEDAFAQDVRIVLASADFSREITSAVLWLNDQGLDIRCVRMRPHRLESELLLDVQQLIPLPEAQEFQIQVRDKQQKERQSRASSMDYTRYDLDVYGEHYDSQPKRWLMFYCFKHLVENGVAPESVAEALPWRRNRLFEVFDGELDGDQVIEAMNKRWPSAKSPRFKRFFRKDDEVFHIGGRTFVLSNQWGDRTLEAVDSLAASFPQANIQYQAAK